MEDATGKHPVTPGEVVPARELLGDLYMEMGETAQALVAYQANLATHPNRFNGISGAALAEEKLKDIQKASGYYQQLVAQTGSTDYQRPELKMAAAFVKQAARK